MRNDGRLPRWASWTIGLGLVVAAWFVAFVTPDDGQAAAPFVIETTAGERAVGRNLDVTVVDVRRADTVSADGWSADGNWLVVDLEVASVVSETGALFSHAELAIDGARYRASDRPDSLAGQPLSAGIPMAGSIAFELPEGLDSGDAVLELAIDGDTRLDSMVVMPVDLAAVPHELETELRETGWAKP